MDDPCIFCQRKNTGDDPDDRPDMGACGRCIRKRLRKMFGDDQNEVKKETTKSAETNEEDNFDSLFE